jgi:hypothetical protein
MISLGIHRQVHIIVGAEKISGTRFNAKSSAELDSYHLVSSEVGNRLVGIAQFI